VTTSTSGADTLRAAAAALDRIAELVAARTLLDAEILAAVRAADAHPDITQEQIAPLLGLTTTRGLRKWLAARQEAS
jgi:hypothetical protein